MNIKLLHVTVLLAALNTALFSQLNLDAELRPRTEFRHGYKSLLSPADDPAFFTSQRTRLNLKYGLEKFRFLVNVQDVRTWGSTPQLSISDGLTSLYMGWAEADLGDIVQLRVGRQELVYDDHRILGNVGWAQQGRSHDLALVKIAPANLSVHVGLAYNQDKEQVKGNFYTVPNNYKTMQFLWASGKLGSLSLSGLFLNNGMQYFNNADSSSSTLFSQTLGAHADYASNGLALTGSAYYQFGIDRVNRSLNAFQVSLRASYSFADRKWEPLAGFEILSGTGQSTLNSPGNERNNSFSPLYGTNHKFNGLMDYFYVGNHSNDVGLVDLYAGLTHRPGSFSWSLAIHQFSSHADIVDPVLAGSTLPKSLGTEVDLVIAFRHSEFLTLQAGYSQMFATASMEALKGGDRKVLQNWAWIMLTCTPKFIRTGTGSE
jgi:hypothetical protein